MHIYLRTLALATLALSSCYKDDKDQPHKSYGVTPSSHIFPNSYSQSDIKTVPDSQGGSWSLIETRTTQGAVRRQLIKVDNLGHKAEDATVSFEENIEVQDFALDFDDNIYVIFYEKVGEDSKLGLLQLDSHGELIKRHEIPAILVSNPTRENPSMKSAKNLTGHIPAQITVDQGTLTILASYRTEGRYLLRFRAMKDGLQPIYAREIIPYRSSRQGFSFPWVYYANEVDVFNMSYRNLQTRLLVDVNGRSYVAMSYPGWSLADLLDRHDLQPVVEGVGLGADGLRFYDILFAAYDTEGNELFAKTIGTVGQDVVGALMQESDKVYLAYSHRNYVSDEPRREWDSTILALKADDGQELWSYHWEEAGNEIILAAAVDAQSRTALIAGSEGWTQAETDSIGDGRAFVRHFNLDTQSWSALNLEDWHQRHSQVNSLELYQNDQGDLFTFASGLFDAPSTHTGDQDRTLNASKGRVQSWKAF